MWTKSIHVNEIGVLVKNNLHMECLDGDKVTVMKRAQAIIESTYILKEK